MGERMLRRGLPRVAGGEPWPPADVVVEMPADPEATSIPDAESAPVVASAAAVAQAPVAPAAVQLESAGAQSAAAVAGLQAAQVVMRRGLPRTPGGEPWPPAAAVDAAPRESSTEHAARATEAPTTAAAAGAAAGSAAATHAPTAAAPASETTTATETQTTAVPSAADRAVVRRGLPRVTGGDAWPPAGTVPLAASDPTIEARQAAAPVGAAPVAPAPVAPAAVASTPDASAPVASAPAATTTIVPAIDVSTPLRSNRTVWNGTAPRHVTTATASARRPAWTQAIAGLLGAAALGILAAAAVAFVRALLSFPFMQDFLAAFPGEYHPAIEVAPGFAPWVGWQHFFNAFLMVLIIRSGMRIRSEKRPNAFWTPRNNPKGKVSLTIWFHQSLDILWLANGVIFIVLLIVTGHWVRIVPTSWEVFPNALSAALQYVSFDWPTENGWVNYNSLQQLAYFATVFIAAPLAAVTGFRMSGMWPKRAERLSKAYPIEWARALHFPVMLYFVAFIVAHVALVMLTGFLRNLNHMYASQDAVTWTGFWVFVASLVVIAIGWVAARPLVLAPIARLFGNVSAR